MARPFYSKALVVLRDRDSLAVVGPPTGPAGGSTVELPDGDVWLVDHVDPANAVLLESRLGDPLSPLMVAAYGGDGALFLQDRARPVGDDPDHELSYIADRRPGPIRYRPGTRVPIDISSARRAGLSVLLADLVDDQGRHPLSRLAAALSFGLGLDGSPVSDALEGLVTTMQGRSLSFGDHVDEDELWSLGDDAAVDLLGLCDRAVALDSRWRPAVGDLAEQLRHIQEPIQMAASMAPLEDRFEELRVTRELYSFASAPLDQPEPQERIVEWQEPGVLAVSVQRDETGRWARVLRRDGLVLLGQAPLRRDGLMDTAEVLVPADLSRNDLVVQVADEAEARSPARGPAEAIRSAVSAGRNASRAQRLGMDDEASKRWRRCAELWAAADDPVREGQALDLAAHPLRGPALSDPVVDRIEETLGTG